MKFGPVPINEAEGCILAHSTKLHGKGLKKGHLLTLDDVEAIAKTGASEVIVARLADDDVGENEAAKRVARALQAKAKDTNLDISEATTGRVNLFARCDGLLQIDRTIVDAFNAVTPDITLATLMSDTLVKAGRMVATVKIIPFAVSGTAVAAVEDLPPQHVEKALCVYEKFPRRVALIQTVLPSTKSSVLDKTRRNLEARLAETQSWIEQEIRVPHDTQALADTLHAMRKADDAGYDSTDQFVIIFGASAISDIDDVIPSALRMDGGEVDAFGMPVDPGNLLMVGRLYNRHVLGAPGCARSSAENGFDWVLRRLTHLGLNWDLPEWIRGLGVGGLLMEIHDRPQPRDDV